MQIKERIENQIAILTLTGPLLCEPDTMKLRERVYKLIEEKIVRLVIDLEGLTYINSCGLGLLIAIYTSLRKVGGDVRLVQIGDNVQNLFAITQLTKVFSTFRSVEDAVASFHSSMRS